MLLRTTYFFAGTNNDNRLTTRKPQKPYVYWLTGFCRFIYLIPHPMRYRSNSENQTPGALMQCARQGWKAGAMLFGTFP
jgi:hypothetical protein